MDDPIRSVPWKPTGIDAGPDLERLVTREWLVTNGLGGYASGTIAGVVTRRYHGMLVSAQASPLGRLMMLNQIQEQVKFADKSRVEIGGEERGGKLLVHGAEHLAGFRLELGLPVWRYQVRDAVLEKRVFMAHRQNTVFVNYRLLEGPAIALRLRPAIHFRGHDDAVSTALDDRYQLTSIHDQYEIVSLNKNDWPTLRMYLYGEEASFTIHGRRMTELLYRTEESRGYDYRGDLWSPGHFWVDLDTHHDATLVASTEAWETVMALTPQAASDSECDRRRRLISCSHIASREGLGAELVLAADQFVIQPTGRTADAARPRAGGDEVRTVIAGYHWFTDWGRDTMISLEGLTLTTGRATEAGWILRTFAQHVRDGLIPNYFPEGDKEGVYHTADATLWYFHAIARYLEFTQDDATLTRLLPVLMDIIQHHLNGTRFGIGVDPADGLLKQGEHGYQLTWMDAKMGDWVVTPRRGKAVEINALWYNALRLMEQWLRRQGRASEADGISAHAAQAYDSFNQRFWYEDGGYLYDVVDGEDGNDDPSCRPNQIFAISLPHPVLERGCWKPVLETVQQKLLTPAGLRSLAPGSPDYKPQYFGDLRSRDAAYHQGTVWAWLIGPFIDAWLKLHPNDRQGARRLLEGFGHHLAEACIGSISEVFDAESPYTPRGCIAQAWSVAEVLRCWVKTSHQAATSDQSVRAAEQMGTL
jgi:predicted glycogen debranching enzyme